MLKKKPTQPKEIILRLDTAQLTPRQLKLIEWIQHYMINVLSADNEEEYFLDSAQFLKYAIDVIQASDFAKSSSQKHITQQVVEYALDNLEENLNMPHSKIIVNN